MAAMVIASAVLLQTGLIVVALVELLSIVRK
jgi:hypothetical protein